MFAGHLGAALAIGRTERRVNVGVFVVAAFLLDVVLWLFVLLGWESVSIPPNFANTHQPEFAFPYSHSLAAGIFWSGVAAASGVLAYSRLHAAKWRVGALIAAAVFSHWVLDALVHRPEMPVVGAGTSKLGLGLWQNMPVALTVEAAVAMAGLYLFVRGSRLSRHRLISLTLLCLVVLAFTIAGMTVAPPPPSPLAMAGSSLAALMLVCALAAWAGAPAYEKQA